MKVPAAVGARSRSAPVGARRSVGTMPPPSSDASTGSARWCGRPAAATMPSQNVTVSPATGAVGVTVMRACTPAAASHRGVRVEHAGAAQADRAEHCSWSVRRRRRRACRPERAAALVAASVRERRARSLCSLKLAPRAGVSAAGPTASARRCRRPAAPRSWCRPRRVEAVGVDRPPRVGDRRRRARLVVVRIGYRQASPAPMLTQLPPGALIVISGPRSEKPTLVPMWRRPATPITPAQLAGHADRVARAVAGRGDDDAADCVELRDRVDVDLATLLLSQRRRRRGSC